MSLVERLRRLRAGRAVPDLRRSARDVVIVGSSSRGGSSIFAEVLRRHPGLVHFRAEVNPFLVLTGRVHPSSGTGSDALGSEHALGFDTRELAADCGSPSSHLDDPEGFAVDLACRLTMQWPDDVFELDEVRGAVAVALGRLQRDFGWDEGDFRDAQLFWLLLLGVLRARHTDLNPWFYDIDPAMLRDVCPWASPTDRPPGRTVVEEPPFVPVGPWRVATDEELETRPLVVKTPANAYRLPFWRALFPNADLRVLHLARNVAASVNGLWDGWRFGGFHSHDLGPILDIPGYTDAVPGSGRSWWKFDLPPGWEGWTSRPLPEVCAFQWRSAHTSLLDWLDEHPGADRMAVRFEDVVGPERDRVFAELLDWLGAAPHPAIAELLPVVMATGPPRSRRWFARASLLQDVLDDPANRETMTRLGYGLDPAEWG